ncbi:MAG: hypothetical protein M3N54_03285 [Acidobacteriota bacterium]|nr:hypothetical protein [Acidobacteriota bacterium]
MHSDSAYILLCIALFLGAAALTWPVLEMGLIDDWSYNHIARDFAATGHFRYNGWAFAMLIPQVVWSAAFIKLFGFSFLAVRLSTVLLAVFLIPVLYSLGRESGLTRTLAAFATLLCTLSPVVLPLTTSFMSDFPGFFFFVLCFYGAVRSWKAVAPGACLAWAALVLTAGILGGIDRQIDWLGPLLFLPFLAWVHRRSRRATAFLAAAWLCALLTAVWSTLWYQAQPYSLHEDILGFWKRLPLRFMAATEFSLLIDLALTTGLLLLPVLLSYVKPGFTSATRKTALLTLACVAAVACAIILRPLHAVPSLGNVMTPYGILGGAHVATLGVRPLILGSRLRELLTVVVLLACAACCLALWKTRRADRPRLWHDPATPTLILGLVFTAVWLPAMLFRSSGSPAFDRYLITVLPLILIPLLRHYQVRTGPRLSRWSWGTLALFALYGVATTHDTFAMGRARVAAAQALEKSGIPRTGITAGFEYDGWTQLDAAGYINNPQIVNPAGSFRVPTCPGARELRPWFAWDMPAVHPRYYVALSRLPGLEDIPGQAPITYTTWLPPARRQVFKQILPGNAYGGCQ